MERLEPILKQKFWILLGIGMIMTIVGWWIATSSMAAQIVARTGEIKGAFEKVPGGQIPNDSWSAQLAARNKEQDLAKQNTARGLWERQKERMTWPNSVAEFAWVNDYRGDIALTGRENYRTAYTTDVHRVWEVVRPYDPLNGTGIVFFGSPQAEMLPQQQWGVLAPSSAEMWDAQEDLWLLESLLQSITDLNGGANGERLDAAVHVIERLELHGGTGRKSASGPGSTPSKSTGSGATGSGSSGAMNSMMSGGAMSGSGEMGSGLGASMMGGRGSGEPIASADFDWKEEFGDDGSGGSRGGQSSMPSSSMPGPAMSGPAMSGPSGARGGSSGSSGSGASAGPKTRRYIEDEATLPYKTRGFYMTVLMDHRKIPSLIAELTSSEKLAWPVEIVRLQMARIHDDDVEGAGPGGPAMRSGGGLSALLSSKPAGGASMGSGEFGSGASSGPSLGGFGGGGFGGGGGGGFGVGGAGRGAAASSPAAEAANVALETALTDPVMARVALCGIITLYKEVKPDPKLQVAPAPAPTAPKADASATPPSNEAPSTEKPAESATASDSPPTATEAPATESKPADAKPDDTKPAAANPADAKPADPKAPATEPK